MSIVWDKSYYASVPVDLGLDDSLQWSNEKPADWPTAKFKPHEETLQTLMAFHLTEVCGESLKLVGMAGDYWGGPDIIGFDNLGRVHLFELKRHRINEASARQLSYYLLRHVFDNPEKFVGYWCRRMVGQELRVPRLTQAIAGVLAGQQTHNIGYKFARKHGEAVSFSESKWRKLEYEERQPFLVAALLKQAKEKIEVVPTVEEITELAGHWRQRLSNEMSLPQGLFDCKHPVVIWLVGSSFAIEAEEELRRWRAAGIDARCLQAEVRFSSRSKGLIFRVKREIFPERAELAGCLEQWARANTTSGEPAGLRLYLYNETRPSDRGLQENAGLPKKSPYAQIKPDEVERINISVTDDSDCIAT